MIELAEDEVKKLKKKILSLNKRVKELHSGFTDRGDKIRQLTDTITGQAVVIRDMNEYIEKLTK